MATYTATQPPSHHGYLIYTGRRHHLLSAFHVINQRYSAETVEKAGGVVVVGVTARRVLRAEPPRYMVAALYHFATLEDYVTLRDSLDKWCRVRSTMTHTDLIFTNSGGGQSLELPQRVGGASRCGSCLVSIQMLTTMRNSTTIKKEHFIKGTLLLAAEGTDDAF